MWSLGSVPIAENISAYLRTCSAVFLACIVAMFRYLQKYRSMSRVTEHFDVALWIASFTESRAKGISLSESKGYPAPLTVLR